jgi:carotenoid cleavage dioxygenase-like enzyme
MQSKRRVQVLQKHLTATSVEELAWVEPTTSYSNGMFRPVLEETSQLECIVEGKIPNGLKNGTYYRNGPNAKFPAGASDFFHYFDGDGMIASFTFGSTVVFNHKWVQHTV